MSKRLKVGIIGCGGIANGKHLPSLKAIDRVDMVAFCDLIEETRHKGREGIRRPRREGIYRLSANCSRTKA